MKKIYILFVLLFSTVINSSIDTYSPWPMFHGGIKHGGLSIYDTSQVNGTIRWQFEVPNNESFAAGIESSPAIGADGTIYVGYAGNGIYAIDPDGTEKWYFDAGEPVLDTIYSYMLKGVISSPAVSNDGTIYFTSLSDYLFAVNPDGTEKWRYPIKRSAAVWSSPTIGEDGTVYVGAAVTSYESGSGVDLYADMLGNGLFAINPDGSLKWRFFNPGDVVATPAIDNDVIYVGAFDGDEGKGKLYAINSDGELKWEFNADKYIESSPTISKQGIIYIGSGTNELYAVNRDGTEKWRFITESAEVFATPAIGPDGTVYVGTGDFTGTPIFYAINPDGTEKWRFYPNESVEGSAVIGAEGTIYFGTSQKLGKDSFYALNPDGTVKWSFKTKGGVSSTPAIGSDGTLYVSSHNGGVYAFGEPIETVIKDSEQEDEITETEKNRTVEDQLEDQETQPIGNTSHVNIPKGSGKHEEHVAPHGESTLPSNPVYNFGVIIGLVVIVLLVKFFMKK